MEMPLNANMRLNQVSYVNNTHASSNMANQDKWLAGGITLLFHLSMGAFIFAGWVATKPAEPEVRSIKVQMISINTPTPAPQMEVEPAPAEPIVAAPKEIVKPQPQKADVAFKRVEEKPVVEEAPANIQPNIDNDLQEKRLQEAAQQAQANQLREAEESRQKAAQAAAAKQAEAMQLANNQYLPVEKNAPAYPARALEKGLEGSCTVSYNVNTQGRVEAPQALGDCHPLFVKPSLEAAKSFKYSPRVIDGKAVVVSNVKNTFQYRIQ